MKFNNLEDRMLYFRELSNYKLTPNSYVICMIDGRSFSTKIKKYFKQPFDDIFINIMNQVGEYVCKNIQGCKFAYVQSDEISFILTDFDTPETDAFFGYRLNKMLPIISALATSKFNQLMIKENLHNALSDIKKLDFLKIIMDAKNVYHGIKNLINTIDDTIDNGILYEFDCKCWNVPTYNDVIGWLLYRQNDCIRNSKQQASRAYLSHNQLKGLTADKQIELLKKEKKIDWNTDYNDGEKYGRFIYKDTEHYISEKYGEYNRTFWKSHFGKILTDETNRLELSNYIPQQ